MAVPTAAWMKPAVAAALPASKVLAVTRATLPAAVPSMRTTAAPRLPGQRKRPLQEAKRVKENSGKELAAAKEKQKLTKHKEIWMLSSWSSAALTLLSLILHP